MTPKYNSITQIKITKEIKSNLKSKFNKIRIANLNIIPQSGSRGGKIAVGDSKIQLDNTNTKNQIENSSTNTNHKIKNDKKSRFDKNTEDSLKICYLQFI